MVRRVFGSFDYDYDKALKAFLIGQARNPDSHFEAHDWSIKDASSDRQDKARRRIRACDVVVAICSERTHLAKGVAIDLKMAQVAAIQYFLLRGYADRVCTKPTTAKAGDNMYKWTWDNLKLLIGGVR